MTAVEATTKRRGNPEALAEYRRKVAAGEIIPKKKAAPATTKHGRPRDSQRNRLYTAEDAALSGVTDTQLGKRTTSGWNSSAPSIDVAQAWVDALCEERWFQSRWGKCQIPLEGARGNHAYYRGTITLDHRGRTTPYIILHEISHWLSSTRQVAAHGPEFAATMLTLVEGKLGKDAARELRASYSKHKVRYRAGLATVPKPGSKTVVTKTARLEKERQAKVRRQKELASSRRERSHAADVIRALVAEGHFGAAGAKPRAQALAIARSIEA